MVSSCDVSLQLDSPGRRYTNNDVVSGTVTLVVGKSLSLSHIQVKLEGVSTTKMLVPLDSSTRMERTSRRGSKERMVSDEHKVLYETLTVFPPASVRKVSEAKEFTLTPGTYTYPFEFRIPYASSCHQRDRAQSNQIFQVSRLTQSLNMASFGDLFNPTLKFDVQAYHINAQLPPSLGGGVGFASVSYFVKVTCRRSALLKANLRATDPFTFLPLDVEHASESPMVYYRKDILLKGRRLASGHEVATERITPAQKSRFFKRMFDSSGSSQTSSAPAVDIAFSFEARFRNPAGLVPEQPPQFRLYLITTSAPSFYAGAPTKSGDGSNGLGVVYLQSLKVILELTTLGSVLAVSGGRREIHRCGKSEDVVLCNNSYDNLKFDLKDCKPMGAAAGYELEIPPSHFGNCVARRGLLPSFETCNIARRYRLIVKAGFSSEPLADANSRWEGYRKVNEVELVANIRVLSGLSAASNYSANGTLSSPIDTEPGPTVADDDANRPALPQRRRQPDTPYRSSLGGAEPATHEKASYSGSAADDASTLPTYDEVLDEQSERDASRR